MFTLLQQLLEGARSSRRYIWVSGRWVWVYFCSTIQMCEENTLPSLQRVVGAATLVIVQQLEIISIPKEKGQFSVRGKVA